MTFQLAYHDISIFYPNAQTNWHTPTSLLLLQTCVGEVPAIQGIMNV